MEGDDITKAAVAAREEVYRAGHRSGEEILRMINDDEMPYVGPIPPDAYLQYIYYLGVAQAIANHGRSISGLQFGKGNDPQRKAGKA